MPNKKIYLHIELATTPEAAQDQLQKIKDTMTTAIMLKIDSTGITDSNDGFYAVCQGIYLSAHSQAIAGT